jgi:RimJ/RimL family protein N-acetyltransferase
MASHHPILTPRLTILPADCARLEALISSPEAFALVTGIKVAAEFCPFDGALTASLKTLRRSSDHERPWWTPRLIVLNAVSEVIGLIGFKGPPNDGAVELGYSVAPAHQNNGYATEAVGALVGHALRFGHVSVVIAHSLPNPSASTRVLAKCGFQKAMELIDSADGPVWRWERQSQTS